VSIVDSLSRWTKLNSPPRLGALSLPWESNTLGYLPLMATVPSAATTRDCDTRRSARARDPTKSVGFPGDLKSPPHHRRESAIR
jgi:hypothetical protein